MSGIRGASDIGDIDTALVGRFIEKMRRSETLCLVLVTFFLVNAVGAAVFSLGVWWSLDLAPGLLVPAFIVECVSLGLVMMLWRRSNCVCRMYRASAGET